jgi:hypothetical protein
MPSPDAALGDGKGRSATFATIARQFDFENTPQATASRARIVRLLAAGG